MLDGNCLKAVSAMVSAYRNISLNLDARWWTGMGARPPPHGPAGGGFRRCRLWIEPMLVAATRLYPRPFLLSQSKAFSPLHLPLPSSFFAFLYQRLSPFPTQPDIRTVFCLCYPDQADYICSPSAATSAGSPPPLLVQDLADGFHGAIAGEPGRCPGSGGAP